MVVNTALLLTSSSGNPFNSSLTPARLAELRRVLEENYGKKDEQAVHENRVKKVYEELNIKAAYEKYEETVVGILKGRIASVEEKEGGLKRAVFESFLGKIYKRSK